MIVSYIYLSVTGIYVYRSPWFWWIKIQTGKYFLIRISKLWIWRFPRYPGFFSIPFYSLHPYTAVEQLLYTFSEHCIMKPILLMSFIIVLIYASALVKARGHNSHAQVPHREKEAAQRKRYHDEEDNEEDDDDDVKKRSNEEVENSEDILKRYAKKRSSSSKRSKISKRGGKYVRMDK